jgi:hypothetical protein
MHFSTTILGLIATTILAIPTSSPLATVAFYATPTCSGNATSTIELLPDLCYPIIGAQGLKVVKHAAELSYNSCKYRGNGWEAED